MKLKLEIIGNIGSDAVVRDVNGSKAIGFSVAHSEKYKNTSGIDVENTTWVNCTIWKYQGQSIEIAKYLKKGTMVAIEGFPSVRGYQNQQGQIGASMECRVTFIKLLSAKNADVQASEINQNTPPSETDTTKKSSKEDTFSEDISKGGEDEDSLPF
jgi:single-strand DNA-binding protein